MSASARLRGSGAEAPLAFVTGASSGIGQAPALRLHVLGYRLALVARRADEVRAWVVAQGWDAGEAAVHAADVRDIAALSDAGQRTLDAQGVPDIVIAGAGISIGMDSAISADLDVMRATLETNLLGTAAAFQPFVAPMRARGSGRLVGVASVAAIRGLPGHGAYCASKAGVVAYCESLRGELRGSGVRVVTLVPGYVDTPLTRRNSYSMPFLMQPDRFAYHACRSIEAGTSYRVIPWQMGVVAKLFRLLPNMVLDRALQGRGRKPRQDDAGHK
ncbi:MAG: SDR family oxidoreductase [Burkholderiaceae bacterium]